MVPRHSRLTFAWLASSRCESIRTIQQETSYRCLKSVESDYLVNPMARSNRTTIGFVRPLDPNEHRFQSQTLRLGLQPRTRGSSDDARLQIRTG